MRRFAATRDRSIFTREIVASVGQAVADPEVDIPTPSSPAIPDGAIVARYDSS